MQCCIYNNIHVPHNIKKSVHDKVITSRCRYNCCIWNDARQQCVKMQNCWCFITSVILSNMRWQSQQKWDPVDSCSFCKCSSSIGILITSFSHHLHVMFLLVFFTQDLFICLFMSHFHFFLHTQ